MQGEGDLNPGAFEITYTDSVGTPLSGNGTYAVPGGNAVTYVTGRPVASTATNGAGGGAWIFFTVRLVDVLMCSPFGFNYEESFRETGLYGISSLLFTLTLDTPNNARLLQSTSTQPYSMYTFGYNGHVTNPVSNAQLWFTYLSPSIQSTLPPRSISSLCNIQYFQSSAITTGSNQVNDGTALNRGIVTFSAVTFSNVPDVFLISVRPVNNSYGTAYSYNTESDWCCTYPDGAFQQFTFANQSGLFAGFPSHSLTQMSRNNGSKASLAQYGGAGGTGYFMSGGQKTIAGGSVLVIRPGIDFPLPTGVTVGSTGQCQLSFQLQFNAPGTNGTGATTRKFVCTVSALSSGYFITENGVSRQLLVGLDEATVLAAPEGPDRYLTSKLVGGGWMSTLGSFAKNALANSDAIKNIAQQGMAAIKNRDLSGLANAGMGAYGLYNSMKKPTGGAPGIAGGALMAGSGMKRLRPTLAQRLAM